MSNGSGAIPLILHVEELQHFDDDVLEHEVSLKVAGAPETKLVAKIGSHFYKQPRVMSVSQHGVLDLPVALADRLLILVFRLLVSEMTKDCGWEATWSMADSTNWIRHQFPHEGEQLLEVMRPHVRENVRVLDSCSVTIG
ncbi:MAG TPA: hypothetical protein VF669_14255 [Tepidisphaeraceae bacterium]|jgi:hypothetical protein